MTSWARLAIQIRDDVQPVLSVVFPNSRLRCRVLVVVKKKRFRKCSLGWYPPAARNVCPRCVRSAVESEIDGSLTLSIPMNQKTQEYPLNPGIFDAYELENLR